MIEFQNDAHGFAIAQAAGTLLNPIFDVVISRTEDGVLYGGVVFTNYTHEAIGLHLAGFTRHWMSKDLIWVVMHYAFVQLKCSSIFVQLRSRNHNALAFSRKFGFKYVATIPEMFPDKEDCLVYRLQRDDASYWLSIKPKSIVTGSGNGLEEAA